MAKYEEFSCQHEKKISAYRHKGHARKVTKENQNSLVKRIWYLPHFEVIN